MKLADVTDAVCEEAEYSDSDERLIATTLLSGMQSLHC
jgi:hypothetical protein